jgi:hypothetical protein
VPDFCEVAREIKNTNFYFEISHNQFLVKKVNKRLANAKLDKLEQLKLRM